MIPNVVVLKKHTRNLVVPARYIPRGPRTCSLFVLSHDTKHSLRSPGITLEDGCISPTESARYERTSVNLAREPTLYTTEGAMQHPRRFVQDWTDQRNRSVRGKSGACACAAGFFPLSLPLLRGRRLDATPTTTTTIASFNHHQHHHQQQQHPSNCLFDEKTNLGNKPRYLSERVNSVFRDFHFRIDF